jgi:predicted transcriptional regulator
VTGLAVNNEERMLPLIRASLATRLLQKGFRVNRIARVLGVTPAAVTQYLKGIRGKQLEETENQIQILNALTEKAALRLNENMEPLSTVELLDAGHEILTVASGETILDAKSDSWRKSKSSMILKARLQLELKAAQKCLDLANRAKDDCTRLLLRMVASDSIRHADIVSQILSWVENGREAPLDVPDPGLLKEILAIEDNANESSLRKTVRIKHGVAKLLLESIDMDEEKHERLIGKLAESATTRTYL